MRSASLTGYSQLALLSILWGSSFNLTKLAVDSISPVWVVAGRVTIASALLFLFISDKRALWSSRKLSWSRYALQACMMGTIPWGLIAWASQYIDSGATAILGSTTPIFAFLITWSITRHEPATKQKLIGIIIGLLGVASMIGVGSLGGDSTNLAAQVACIVASIIFAMAAIHGRGFDHVPPLTSACATMLMASAMMIPTALVFAGIPSLPTMTALIGLVALGTLSTGLALVLYYRLLATIGSVGTTSNNYLRIGVGVLIGVLFMGELMTLDKLLGLFLVTAGVFAMVRPDRNSRPAA